ncbi:hypothetical protein AVKW3434_04280 [Acidovorax sp. SUPP3434]|nr:hypothetical protein [Acidovorax sp. SUPP3434]GKS98566.1 hypothetical protein AVKW3434_04280 [Acidovorax sp. SUPP3434]
MAAEKPPRKGASDSAAAGNVWPVAVNILVGLEGARHESRVNPAEDF